MRNLQTHKTKKMKTLKFIFSIAFVCVLLFPAQSTSSNNDKKSQFKYELTDDDGNVHEFTLSGVDFSTPSGNILRSYKIKVPEYIMENISFGFFANKILGVRISNINNSGETVIGYGFLNKAGNLNFNVHSNGAGNEFPKGW